MRYLETQPLRRQVLVAACVLLSLLSVAVAYSAITAWRERVDEVRDESARVATSAGAVLDEYFASLDAMAAVLVRHPAIRALDGERAAALFVGLIGEQPLLNNVVLRSASGELIASGMPLQPSSTAVPPPADVVAQAVATGRAVASQLTVGPITGERTVLVAYPVRGDAGAIVGTVGFSLNLTRIQRVFASILLPEGSSITLVDRFGRVLARSRDGERYIGTLFDATPVEPKDVPRTTVRTDRDGVTRFHGNVVIDRGPWLLSVGIPRQVVTARLLPMWRRNAAVVLTANITVLLLALWIAGMLSRQLRRLKEAAQRIADGDLTPPPRAPAANLEVDQLQSAFVTMAGRLRDTRDALDRQVEQERKTGEMLQSLQRQVVRQERLAAVGLLVSGVAHELNNPLQAILGTIELLERQPGLERETLEEIGFIKTQSGRAREIIRNLSRFSSQQPGPPAVTDLRDVVTEVIQLRRGDLDNASIALDVEIASIRKVYANFTELEQVTLNFVINAQQAIEEAGRSGGRIAIRIVDASRRVRLEVMDNGPGVGSQDEPKLFQPFFTTKPVGKGTGLGLSVSYGIIESYGGTIGYHGNEWGGATFFFELPAVDSLAANDRAAVLRGSVSPRV